MDTNNTPLPYFYNGAQDGRVYEITTIKYKCMQKLLLNLALISKCFKHTVCANYSFQFVTRYL